MFLVAAFDDTFALAQGKVNSVTLCPPSTRNLLFYDFFMCFTRASEGLKVLIKSS